MDLPENEIDTTGIDFSAINKIIWGGNTSIKDIVGNLDWYDDSFREKNKDWLSKIIREEGTGSKSNLLGAPNSTIIEVKDENYVRRFRRRRRKSIGYHSSQMYSKYVSNIQENEDRMEAELKDKEIFEIKMKVTEWLAKQKLKGYDKEFTIDYLQKENMLENVIKLIKAIDSSGKLTNLTINEIIEKINLVEKTHDVALSKSSLIPLVNYGYLDKVIESKDNITIDDMYSLWLINMKLNYLLDTKLSRDVEDILREYFIKDLDITDELHRNIITYTTYMKCGDFLYWLDDDRIIYDDTWYTDYALYYNNILPIYEDIYKTIEEKAIVTSKANTQYMAQDILSDIKTKVIEKIKTNILKFTKEDLVKWFSIPEVKIDKNIDLERDIIGQKDLYVSLMYKLIDFYHITDKKQLSLDDVNSLKNVNLKKFEYDKLKEIFDRLSSRYMDKKLYNQLLKQEKNKIEYIPKKVEVPKNTLKLVDYNQAPNKDAGKPMGLEKSVEEDMWHNLEELAGITKLHVRSISGLVVLDIADILTEVETKIESTALKEKEPTSSFWDKITGFFDKASSILSIVKDSTSSNYTDTLLNNDIPVHTKINSFGTALVSGVSRLSREIKIPDKAHIWSNDRIENKSDIYSIANSIGKGEFSSKPNLSKQEDAFYSVEDHQIGLQNFEEPTLKDRLLSFKNQKKSYSTYNTRMTSLNRLLYDEDEVSTSRRRLNIDLGMDKGLDGFINRVKDPKNIGSLVNRGLSYINEGKDKILDEFDNKVLGPINDVTSKVQGGLDTAANFADDLVSDFENSVNGVITEATTAFNDAKGIVDDIGANMAPLVSGLGSLIGNFDSKTGDALGGMSNLLGGGLSSNIGNLFAPKKKGENVISGYVKNLEVRALSITLGDLELDEFEVLQYWEEMDYVTLWRAFREMTISVPLKYLDPIKKLGSTDVPIKITRVYGFNTLDASSAESINPGDTVDKVMTWYTLDEVTDVYTARFKDISLPNVEFSKMTEEEFSELPIISKEQFVKINLDIIPVTNTTDPSVAHSDIPITSYTYRHVDKSKAKLAEKVDVPEGNNQLPSPGEKIKMPTNLFESIGSGMKDLNAVVSKVGKVIDDTKNVIDTAKQTFEKSVDIFDKIKNYAKNIKDKIFDLGNKIKDRINYYADKYFGMGTPFGGERPSKVAQLYNGENINEDIDIDEHIRLSYNTNLYATDKDGNAVKGGMMLIGNVEPNGVDGIGITETNKVGNKVIRLF